MNTNALHRTLTDAQGVSQRTEKRFLSGALILLVFFATALVATAQEREIFSHPPTSFSAEDDRFPNEAQLVDCVRQSLAADGHVVIALKHEGLTAAQLPDEWFTAFTQDLGGQGGRYWVVMGARHMRGANVNPFWIFRQTGGSCDLLLAAPAHDVEILRTQTNGAPDLQIAAETAAYYFTVVYEFDGKQYQVAKRGSAPIGEEVPVDLSGFKARKEVAAGSAEDPTAILNEARGWLWTQWRRREPSYLRLKLVSKEGDETTTKYFIRKTGDNLDVLIQTHRVLVNRNPRSGAPHSVVEDRILIAPKIERRWALTGNPDRQAKVPDNQQIAPDMYELYFDGDSGSGFGVEVL